MDAPTTAQKPLDAPVRSYRSKTAATWIALLGGAVGLHRFYLHGFRDPWGWLFLPPTLAGFVGIERMRHLGADDRLAWVLIPWIGLTLSIGAFAAIVHGLTPDERWNARHGDGGPGTGSGAGAILGVILALLAGGIVLMATIAFSAQRWFEAAAERSAVPTDSAAPAGQGKSPRPIQ